MWPGSVSKRRQPWSQMSYGATCRKFTPVTLTGWVFQSKMCQILPAVTPLYQCYVTGGRRAWKMCIFLKGEQQRSTALNPCLAEQPRLLGLLDFAFTVMTEFIFFSLSSCARLNVSSATCYKEATLKTHLLCAQRKERQQINELHISRRM